MYIPDSKAERGPVRVKCIAQEHDIMTLARFQNWISQPGGSGTWSGAETNVNTVAPGVRMM